MPTIPIYFDPKQLTTAVLTPVTVAADGTTTDVTASAIDLLALDVFKRIEFNPNRGNYENSSADQGDENMMSGKRRFRVAITCLDGNGKVSVLFDLYTAYDYAKLVIQGTSAGTTGGAAKKTLTIYFKIDDLQTGYMEGPNNTTLIGVPAGATYTWA